MPQIEDTYFTFFKNEVGDVKKNIWGVLKIESPHSYFVIVLTPFVKRQRLFGLKEIVGDI